jgi:hypothetical protein
VKPVWYAVFFVFSVLSGEIHALPTAKVTIKVVDESGMPIKGAKAGVGFAEPRKTGGDKEFGKSGLTDKDGLFSTSRSTIYHISYGAKKDGYYATALEYDFKDVKGIPMFKRWQPWNPTLTVVLKKKKKPTALYVKDLRLYVGLRGHLTMPTLNSKVGYDLEKADWVMPYGLGTHSDFIFEMKGSTTAFRQFDYTLNLTFSNEGDGIIPVSAPPRFGSLLRLPHEAPKNGYLPELVQRLASTPEYFVHKDFPDDRNYFFRVRTEKDEEGNIVSALYGKIHGNIHFNEGKKVGFLYYLNPNANDRNLEFDNTRNLFKRLDYSATLRP